MGTFTWTARMSAGGTKTIATSNSVGFYGAAVVGSSYPIELGQWNTHTYYATVSGSKVYELHNTSYTDPLPISDTSVPVQVTFTATSSVYVLAASLRAFALGEVNPPQGMTILAAEASGSSVGVPVNGSSVWAQLSGSLGSYHLDLEPRLTASTSHIFRIAVTVSPTDVGKHIGNVLQLTVEYY